MNVTLSSSRNPEQRTALRIIGRSDALLAEIGEITRQWLAGRMHVMLAQLDDTLFEMAVSALTGAEQNLYFDAMRELRTRREEFLQVSEIECVERLGLLFEAALGADSKSLVMTGDCSADAQAVALRAMATRAVAMHQGTLSGFYGLLNGVIGRRRFDSAQFQLWPALLCAGCNVASRCLVLDAAALQVLFNAFEQCVLHELDELCVLYAGTLTDAGIAPLVDAENTAERDREYRPGRARPAIKRDLIGFVASDEGTQTLVSRLFDRLCRDELLAVPLLAQLARIQPVVARLAQRDITVLSCSDHPLAVLVNEVGDVALGWQSHDIAADTLLEQLTGIVDVLLASGEPDLALMQQLLAAWRVFAGREGHRIQLNQRRTEEVEQTSILGTAANAAVDALLLAQLGERRLPAAAEELLRDAWRRVLVTAYLRSGSGAEPWLAGVRDMLEFVALWSRTTYALPDALALRMRDAMTHAGCDPLRIEILLSSVNEAFGYWEPLVPVLEPEHKWQESLLMCEAPNSPDMESVRAVDDVLRGTWFRFEGHGGTALYGKLALRSGDNGALLFVNYHGNKLASFTRTQLFKQLQLRRATVVAERALFDDALTAALTRLRSERHHAA